MDPLLQGTLRNKNENCMTQNSVQNMVDVKVTRTLKTTLFDEMYAGDEKTPVKLGHYVLNQPTQPFQPPRQQMSHSHRSGLKLLSM